MLTRAEPNPAHEAIAALEKWHVGRGGSFLLVTQNVDGLHGDAGSEQVVEVHGRADRMRCAGLDCVNSAPKGSLPRREEDFEALLDSPSLDTVPRCDVCGELLRPHVLWFDERYADHHDYRIDEVLRASKRAGVILFAGTSFAVGVTEAVLGNALQRGAKLFNVDPSGRSPHARVTTISAAAESVLPELVAAL